MLKSTAQQRIEYVYSFIEYPEGPCKDDWNTWCPLIALACAAVDDESRNKGIKTIQFFNDYFPRKQSLS